MNISQNSQNENSQNNTKQFSEGSMDKEKNDDIVHIKEKDKMKNDLPQLIPNYQAQVNKN